MRSIKEIFKPEFGGSHEMKIEHEELGFLSIVKAPAEYEKWWIGLEGRCEECGTVVQLQPCADMSSVFRISWKPRLVEYSCPTCEALIQFRPPTIRFFKIGRKLLGLPSQLDTPENCAVLDKLKKVEQSKDGSTVLSGDESETLKHIMFHPRLWDCF